MRNVWSRLPKLSQYTYYINNEEEEGMVRLLLFMTDVQSSHWSTPMHASVYTPQDEPQQVNECTADCGYLFKMTGI